jgi:hypothetical protein
MSTGERLATAVMLIPGAIWAGIVFFYAVERVVLWARMPLDQYVVDFRRSLYRADPLQPILAIVSAGGAVWFALQTDGTASTFAWIAVALYALVIAISVLFPERINSQFRRRAEGEAPPDVAALRVRWRKLHLIRTVPAMGVLVCLVLATTYV